MLPVRRLGLPLLVALGSVLGACGAARPPARVPAPKPPAVASPPPQPSTPPAAPAPAALPSTWARLGAVRPLWIARNRPGPISDAAHPADVAYCVPGSVRLSHDGGRSWSSLPVTGAIAATAATPFPVKAFGRPASLACTAALADPSHRATAYAVFAAGRARYGMPPVYAIPLVTTDGGRRWRVVAPPAGFTAAGFGGFQASGGRVRAIFGRAAGAAAASSGPSFGVVATSDGGATWRPASLACPAAGPCLAWGPAASGTGSCAMHAYPQAIEASGDGGRTWRTLAAPAGSPPTRQLASGCALNQLAALSPARVALIGNDLPVAADALRISDDGGATWHAVALPAPPQPTRALQMLPSGALLAPVFVKLAGGAFGNRLDLLAPGARAWCRVPGVTLAGANTDPATVQAAGGRLWWIASPAHGTPALRSVALSAVRC